MKKYIKVYEDLKRKIENSMLKPEDKLPTNAELAEIYNVSIITIKSSLSMLKEENLIYTISGVGTFVSNVAIATTNPTKLKLSLIVPDFSEAFCLEIVNVFERMCRENNITPIISRTFGNIDLENLVISEHLEHGTNGICIMPIHDEYFNPELLRLSLNHFPVVTIDRTLPSIQLSSVITDNRKSSVILANYALNKKLNHPLVISPSFKNSYILTQRVINFIKCFDQHKILNYDNYIPALTHEFSATKQQEMIDKLLATLNQGIDVIFCVEYNIALDVRRFLTSHNIDIEIVCFDHPIASERIKFTHIKQNQHQIAINAFTVLTDQIKLNTNIQHIEIPGTLIHHSE